MRFGLSVLFGLILLFLVAFLLFPGLRGPGPAPPAPTPLRITTSHIVSPARCESNFFAISITVNNQLDERIVAATSIAFDNNVRISHYPSKSISANGSETLVMEGRLIDECGEGTLTVVVVAEVANDPQPPRTTTETEPVTVGAHSVMSAGLVLLPQPDPLDATPGFSHTVGFTCCAAGAINNRWSLPPISEHVTGGPVSQILMCAAAGGAPIPPLATGNGSIGDGFDRGKTVHSFEGAGGGRCIVSRDVERFVSTPELEQ